jgi:hypothetical protein
LLDLLGQRSLRSEALVGRHFRKGGP